MLVKWYTASMSLYVILQYYNNVSGIILAPSLIPLPLSLSIPHTHLHLSL